MKLGDTFIRLFNELSAVLRAETRATDRTSFFQLVEDACNTNLAVRRSKSFLRTIGNLRNAIVHERKYPEEIVADPRAEVVRQLEKLIQKIKLPTKVIPRFQREIMVFEVQNPLANVLVYMQSNDYSQVVVRTEEEYRVLSSEGIVRWLGGACQIGLADIEDAIVGDAYRHEDPKGHRHLARDETIDSAALAFERAIAEGIPRLQAILITERGIPTERPLGIITPWDLLGIEGKNELAWPNS